ncbi:MAG TPA: hypothetical protein DCY13_08005, partial [Verrucomicrobiales bacterium]|nr:hypothetical protein [Verrucomicrobiales bacterium]
DRLLVNRVEAAPRWEPIARLLAVANPRQQARLTTLARDVACLRLSRPLWARVQSALDDRSAMESAAVMITDPDGSIRLANRAFAGLTGIDPAGSSGARWLQLLVPEEDWPQTGTAKARPLFEAEQGRLVWIKHRHLPAFPVRMFTASLNGQVGCVTVLVNWTRQHKKMEDQSRQERLYRRFFDEDVTGHYVSAPDGRLLECNLAFARIFGFDSVESALKSNLRQLHVTGESGDQFFDLLRRNGRLIHHESPMRRVDGRQIHVIQNVTGSLADSGELKEISGYLFDNTERHEVEARVRQSQKMETVGRLAGGIAHDFNNLLLAIQGYATLLEDHVEDKPDGREAVQQILKAADRAATLTRQLLAFSRRQVLQPTELNLNESIQSLSPLLQRLLGENIDLVAQLEANLWPVHADGGRIEEALVNLCSNARDAMPRGGRLNLSTRNTRLQDTWFSFHDGPPPGDYVELTVQDNGVGMSDEVKAHLFEPFYTTKAQGKGTGLGLPTVYGIVKQSGGEIQVYSSEGEGTTFKILLPRLHAGREVPPPETNGGGKDSWRILVVEDEPAVRLLVKKILERKGHRVIEASSGSEALSQMEQEGADLDLVLTDLVMPGLSGRELWEHLRVRWPNLPVIYMSGYTEDAVVKHGVLKEKVSFLQKPFKPDALLEKLQEVMQPV